MSSLNIKFSNYFYFKKYLQHYLIIILLIGVTSVVGFYIPQKIDAIYTNYQQKELFLKALRNLLILFFLQYFVRVFYRITINFLVKKILVRIRTNIFQKWMNVKVAQGDQTDDKYPLGEVLSRLINDTQVIKELLDSGAFTIILDLFFVASCMLGFLKANTFYGIGLIIIELVSAIFLVWLSKYIAIAFLKVRKSTGDLSRSISDLTGGIRELYFIPNQNYPVKRSDKVLTNFLNLQLKANLWDAGYFSLTESLFPLYLVFIVLLFPYSELVNLATFAVLIDLIQRSIGPIKDIASKISAIQRASSGLVRISEFDGDLSLNQDMVREIDSITLEKNLKLLISDFSYKATQESFRIHDFDLNHSLGETVALIGESGCGKSTVLKILAGHLMANKIQLELDGEKFQSNDPDKIRHFLQYSSCLITQDAHIYSESLAFNICLDEAEEVQVETFWREMGEHIPYLKKWDINVDDQLDPQTLSQGQKQLIASLRFCFKPKPIVLFDEISSALDSELELSLRQAMDQLKKSSLIFVVAHRIETIIHADQIYLMDQGRCVDRGKHNSLLKSSQLYNNVIKVLQKP